MAARARLLCKKTTPNSSGPLPSYSRKTNEGTLRAGNDEGNSALKSVTRMIVSVPITRSPDSRDKGAPDREAEEKKKKEK